MEKIAIGRKFVSNMQTVLGQYVCKRSLRRGIVDINRKLSGIIGARAPLWTECGWVCVWKCFNYDHRASVPPNYGPIGYERNCLANPAKGICTTWKKQHCYIYVNPMKN